MALCVYCNAQETELYENGVPICLKCADRRKPVSVYTILTRNLHEATLKAESASAEFQAVSNDIPSFIPQPDASQRIHNVSRALSAARDEMMKAHKRLNEYVEHGIVPDDLKQGSGS